jgi:hypothetical protein
LQNVPKYADNIFFTGTIVARLKKGWSQKSRSRSLEDIGSAISFNIWQTSGQSVLDLENEAFQIDTYSERLDVLSEFSAYLLQVVDRLSFDQFEQNDRHALITATGLHLAEIMQDNRVETDGTGEYRKTYLSLLNDRIQDYSSCQFEIEEGASFVFLRLLGDHVTDVMGDRDSKWITSYVIDKLGPSMFLQIKRVLPGLIDPAQREDDEERQMLRQNHDA